MEIISGIVIGACGGGTAGLVVYFVKLIHEKIIFSVEAKRIYKWLGENTTAELGCGFRSTRDIASWNNLTEDRTRFICSNYKKIYLCTNFQEEMWGINIKTFPRNDNFMIK